MQYYNIITYLSSSIIFNDRFLVSLIIFWNIIYYIMIIWHNDIHTQNSTDRWKYDVYLNIKLYIPTQYIR